MLIFYFMIKSNIILLYMNHSTNLNKSLKHNNHSTNFNKSLKHNNHSNIHHLNNNHNNHNNHNNNNNNNHNNNHNNHNNNNNNYNNNKSIKHNDSSSSSHPLLNIFFMLFTIVMIYLIAKLSYYIYLRDCKKIPVFQYLFSFELSPCIKEQEKPNNTLSQGIIPREKEVFHISNQVYTYEEAICKCKSYGVELATKQQMIDAYNKGANWCSYGWSHGSMAFYPVQPKYFFNNPNSRRKCRQPGLNGGIMNKELKLGINCYGVKPKGSVPFKPQKPSKPKDFCEIKGVKQLTSVNSSDNIRPFNHKEWSMYD